MNLIYSLFRRDPSDREDIITMTSGLGIAVNLLLAGIKIFIGLMTSSIAILSEGANNAADVMTSVLALLGAVLSKKHPDEKHPFGYGRLEYLASLVISALILATGIEMLSNAVKRIFNPVPLSITYLALVIIAVSALIKFFLGIYTISMGKKADSTSLVGVGLESRNDGLSSIITILSFLIFLLFHISIDAYAGILISAMIVKAGIDTLMDTVSELIGRPGEHELAMKLYRIIRGTKGILAAADMRLHNYGPNAWSGSVNVEIDHKKTVGEVYELLHELQLKIMHEMKVTLVFGIYAVDNDHDYARELRKRIAYFVKATDHVKSFHAVFLDKASMRMYCDLVVDYELRDWSAVRDKFAAYMAEHYPEYQIELTIETDFV